MKSKRMCMGLAALMILIFHLYIPLTGSSIELSVQKAGYVGVDIFIFLSAVSLSKRKDLDFMPFLINRIRSVYAPFLVFAGIAAVYKGWTITRFIRVACFAEFLQKGGGAFLWYGSGIMILYLLAPLLLRMKSRFRVKGLAIMLLGWLMLALICQYGFGYDKLFILINRLPIFCLGLYYDCYEKDDKGRYEAPVMICVFVIGCVLLYRYGAILRLTKPIRDIYYILAVPFVLTLVLGIEKLADKRPFILQKPLDAIGSFTFELYALQMIFGYDIENSAAKLTGSNTSAFLVTAAILTGLSYVCYRIKRGWMVRIERKIER